MAETMPPKGYRFRPHDDELISHYLFRKIKGLPLSWNGITECDLYGDKSPWEVFDENKISYVFTWLKRASKNRIARKAGCGTWHGQDSGKKIYDPNTKNVIGSKKTSTFRVKDSTMNTEKSLGNWIMHEYSLAGDLLGGEEYCDYVLCRIEKNVNNGSNEKEVEGEEREEESCGVNYGASSSSTENPINESEALSRGAVVSDDDVLLTNQFDSGVNTTDNDMEAMKSLEVIPTSHSFCFGECGMEDHEEVSLQSFLGYGVHGIKNQSGSLLPSVKWDSVTKESDKGNYGFLKQESEFAKQELEPNMPLFDSSIGGWDTFDVDYYLVDDPQQAMQESDHH